MTTIMSAEKKIVTLALKIIPGGEIERIELGATDGEQYRAISDGIGNVFGRCFTVYDRETGYPSIIGYCDDEFLLGGPNAGQWNLAIGVSLRVDAPYPIGGPVIIVGCTEGGDTRGLTEGEVDGFELEPREHAEASGARFSPGLQTLFAGLPMLEWNR